MTAFGALLRQYRVRAALSQNECARRSKVDPAYVNRMEHGGCPPPSRAVTLRLANTLGLGFINTDRLLIAAGHCPEIVLRMSERQFGSLYALMGEDAVEPSKLRAVQ